jgi:predicted CXXCH cytochrome family protein
LWNHQTTTATFTPYRSETLDALVGQPAGPSKACLSCHDGTVAVNSFGGTTGGEFISGSGLVGTDLSNDHPISLTYDPALAIADGGLHDPTLKTVPALGGKTIQKAMLTGNQLQCTSCHDVHKSRGDSASDKYSLVVRNDRSQLCLTCHNK